MHFVKNVAGMPYLLTLVELWCHCILEIVGLSQLQQEVDRLFQVHTMHNETRSCGVVSGLLNAVCDYSRAKIT